MAPAPAGCSQPQPVPDPRGVCLSLRRAKVYARFFWQQTGQDRYRLLLTNPLGSTELSLTAQPGSVQLIDNKGQTYTATDAEEMIGRLTGMPIPLNSLRQWIIGLPGDATDYSLTIGTVCAN